MRGTISMHFVTPVVAALRRRRLPVAPALRHAGIPVDLLASPQARVSAQSYSLLWRAVIVELDDEFFGQDSRRMKPGSFALLTRSVVHCSNLRSALARTCRFFAICLDDHSLKVERSRGEVALIVESAKPRVFAHETLLVMAYGLACWLVGRRLAVQRAEFAYPPPPHAMEYGPLFGQSPTFSRQRTALALPEAVLDLPIVQTEKSAKEFLRVAPENILLRYKRAHGVAWQVRRRLRDALPGALPDLEAVAAAMRVSPATLRRHLSAEGHSYQSLKDELRRDLAISYLGDGRRSIAQIADALGYGETSAFHRAFRKWTGIAPGAYRHVRAAQPR